VFEGSKEELLGLMRKNLSSLRHLVKADQPNQLINVDIIEQQINILLNPNYPSPATSHRQPLKEISFTASDQMPSPKTVQEILSPPVPFVRRRRRNYKRINYGVMNCDEIMEQYEKEEEIKKEAERLKHERKMLKEEKKVKTASILKIKKEPKEKINLKKTLSDSPLFVNPGRTRKSMRK
jgi:hypothetical protein